MSERKPREMGVSDVRANMTEVIAEVRILGAPVILTRRETPQAVLISVAAYQQAEVLSRLVDLLRERDVDLYEELISTAAVEQRKVRPRRPDLDDDIL